MTTQPRGLNFCPFVFATSISHLCHTYTNHDGVPPSPRATNTRRGRRDAIAHPGRARRFPHRPHAVALSPARSPGPHALSAHRRRTRRRRRPNDFIKPSRRRRRSAVASRAEPASARDAFDATLAFLDQARAGGGNEPATFLLDEVLELRTFESFPGLRTALRELLKTLSTSSNRFVLTTRYVSRAHRLLKDATSRFEVIHVPPLSSAEVRDLLLSIDGGQTMLRDEAGSESLARAVYSLSDGRVGYAQAIGEALSRMVDAQGVGDPVSALTSLLSPDGRLAASCASCYELRLHRARGYGALKAILEILAQEEPLTLTEVAQRLRRTPGSTKDYLSWLEDVDLIVSQRKRYSFSDPLLRVWVRLYCRPRLPVRRRRRARGAVVRARAPAAAGAGDGRRRRRRERARRRRPQAVGHHRNRLTGI